MLHTVESDVLVLAVSSVVLLENTELWVAFVTGKHLRYIPAHDIAIILGGEKARALHSPCSIPSRVATMSHNLLAEGKRLHLTSGSLSMKSPQYKLPCQQIHGASKTTSCVS